MANTHKVRKATQYGDSRPSRRNPNSPADRFTDFYEWDTTEHGARCIFGRELNADRRSPGYVTEEELPHNPDKPDRRVVYVVTRWEGVTKTHIYTSELWPRYSGMYDGR